ncbi:1609_t:CDS:2 [Ambispora leptoticha]|uniref:1609_t:CDS:1 n=1 Tax=Ambispora leptoticha TaxID=144679 RepID=A0A9N8ZT92_9GLOM|nr:1609_t:CDS:2 [Ambispora leptoticha]
MESSTKPNIIIVGGGYAGVQVAQDLDKSLSRTHQIILIEKKTHFYHAVGSLRAMVEENFEEKILVPYTLLLKNGGKVVHASVTEIHKNEVIVDTETEWGTSIPFEYLILATGSSYAAPAKVDKTTKEEIVSEIGKRRDAVKNSNKILIIGGGAVGIELAGELATVYKEKTITLVHAGETLLHPKFPKKLRDDLYKQLKDLNVNVIFGEKLVLPEGGLGDGVTYKKLQTNKGTTIESDVQFFAIGAKPNTSLVKTLDASLLEEKTNLIKVTPTLQLEHEEFKHMFAVGDVTNIDETKMAYRAGLQAAVVTKNVEALISKKKLTEYQPPSEVIVVTIGKTGGAGLLPMFGGLVVGPFLVKNLKGKDLFLGKYWKQITGEAFPSLASAKAAFPANAVVPVIATFVTVISYTLYYIL